MYCELYWFQKDLGVVYQRLVIVVVSEESQDFEKGQQVFLALVILVLIVLIVPIVV